VHCTLKPRTRKARNKNRPPRVIKVVLKVHNSYSKYSRKIQDLGLIYNIFHKNREISILTMKEKTARLTLPQSAAIERTKLEKTEQTNKTENTHPYEQKCESHTCSGTINSSMYESDLTTRTLPQTSSAPYSG
jgi:hypothetical protein